MKWTRYFWNVLSGNLARWNDNHGDTLIALNKRVETLDRSERTVANRILETAWCLISLYYGPSRDNNLVHTPISDKRLRSFRQTDYYRLYEIICKALAFFLVIRNRKYQDRISMAFDHLFIGQHLVVVDYTPFGDESVRIVQACIDELLACSDLIDKNDPVFSISFKMMFMQAVPEMDKMISTDLKA